MIKFKSLFVQVASAAFFFVGAPAFAQWQVPDNSVAVGRGAGQGFKNVPLPSGSLLIGQSGIPLAVIPTGDVTISVGGVTTIGAAKVTSAMLNGDVYSTAHTWSGQQTFVAPNLGTPASGVATNLTGTAAGLTAGTVTTNANLTGEVTSAGNATTVTNSSVIAKVLTAFAAGAGTVSSSDSILTALQKIVGNIALKADLASPTFTGVPRAPTASPSNNSTQLATTAYVDAQVAAGVSGVASLGGMTGAVGCGQAFVCASSKVTAYGQFWLGDYGAAGNNATDDSIPFANATTAALAIGGSVKVGLATYLIGTNQVISSGTTLKIEGVHKNKSVLHFSGTGVGLAYTVSNGIVEMRDFAYSCSNTCITLGSSGNATTLNTVERTTCISGNTCMSLVNASAAHIQNNDFFQCAVVCIQVSAPLNPDGGDSWITNNIMLQTGGLVSTGGGIYHIGGGGWKVLGNKINQFNVAYDIQAAFPGGTSSAYQIQNNSMEGCATACIRIQNPNTTGNLFNLVISGNELTMGSGATGIQTTANAAAGVWLRNVGITSNIIRGGSSSCGICVNGMSAFGIGVNTITDSGTITTGIGVGAQSNTGLVVGNPVSAATTKVSNLGSVVTDVNNGP